LYSMNECGHSIRLRRIFRGDGRTLIFAIDHGFFMGPVKGVEKPLEVLEKVVEAGADAVMTTYGIMKNYASSLARKDLGWILTLLDTSPTTVEKSVASAVAMGADAVKVFVSYGSENMKRDLDILWAVNMTCREYGLPVLAEMYPVSRPSPEEVAKMARIGAEYGGDFVKTVYTGDAASFRYVVETCPVPVVVLGGEKIESEQQLLEMVRDSVSVGGAGAAIGRNIFQHPNPADITRALLKIIHSDIQ